MRGEYFTADMPILGRIIPTIPAVNVNGEFTPSGEKTSAAHTYLWPAGGKELSDTSEQAYLSISLSPLSIIKKL